MKITTLIVAASLTLMVGFFVWLEIGDRRRAKLRETRFPPPAKAAQR